MTSICLNSRLFNAEYFLVDTLNCIISLKSRKLKIRVSSFSSCFILNFVWLDSAKKKSVRICDSISRTRMQVLWNLRVLHSKEKKKKALKLNMIKIIENPCVWLKLNRDLKDFSQSVILTSALLYKTKYSQIS